MADARRAGRRMDCNSTASHACWSSGCRSTARCRSCSPAISARADAACTRLRSNAHVERDPRLHRRPVQPRRARRARPTRIAVALDYVGVLAVEMFVVGRSAAGQRAGPASAQQRSLDARCGAHQPVRAAGPRRLWCRSRRSRRCCVQPWRWSTCSATCGPTASRIGQRCWPTRAPRCTSTARRRPTRAQDGSPHRTARRRPTRPELRANGNPSRPRQAR